MTTNTAVQRKSSSAVASPAKTLKDLLNSPAYAGRIREVLADSANEFTAGVVQIANSPEMADVEPHSLIATCLKGALLRLPLNKELGYLWVVPYKNKGVKVAQLQVGYRGYVQLALRTNCYSGMNACPVNAEAYGGRNEIGDPIIKWDFVDETKPAIGYVFAFKTTSGFSKTIYWPKEKVEAHAKRYSQAFRSGYDTPWKSDFDKMATKTTIRDGLSHWGLMTTQLAQAIAVDQGTSKSLDGPIEFPDNTHDGFEPAKPRKASDPIPVEVESEVVREPAHEEDNVPMGDDQPTESKPAEKTPEKPQEKIPEPQFTSTEEATRFLQQQAKDLDVSEESFCAWVAKRFKTSPVTAIVELEEISPARVKEIANNFSKYRHEVAKIAA